MDKAAAKIDKRGVLQVSMIAAVSAVAGGLAVAWWHRKTLSKLQNSINPADIQNSRFSDDIVELSSEDTDAA